MGGEVRRVKAMRRGALDRPTVSVNFAVTWDSRISTRRRTPSDFSSPRDKRRLLEIRSLADAVLAGAATVAADNMVMGLPSAEMRAARVSRGQAPYPLRVLLSNSGRIDPGLRLFEKTFSRIVIFASDRMPRRVRDALAEMPVDLCMHKSQVDLREMLRTLRADYGVQSVDCEGGGQVFRALLAANLVDEICLTLCPRIFGGERAPTLTGAAAEFLPRSVPCALRAMEVIEDECFLRYRVIRP